MKYADYIIRRQNRDRMLRNSLEKNIQLYTDKSHFVYELLQNAEDTGAHCIRFVQYPDRLEVMHDGYAFTSENLLELCDIGQSHKANDLNQIGEFGVGFKSVFGICDTVKLYSAPTKEMLADNCQPFAIEIQDFTKPVDIEPIAVPSAYTTLFVFPYKVGLTFSGFKSINVLTEKLSERLKNLGVTTLLFLHSLALIEYEIKIPGKEMSGQYRLKMLKINDLCTRVSAIETEGKKSDESLSFLKFSMPIDVGISNRTVDIAFAVSTDKSGKTSFTEAKNPYISVFFPTETESKLDFIVQGPFRTAPNRSSVPADDEENIALAKQIAVLLRKSLYELRRMKLVDLSLISVLPIAESRFEYYSLFKPLYSTTLDLLTKEDFLPAKDGDNYIRAENALIVRSKDLAEVFTNDLISEFYNNGKNYQWLPVSLTDSGPFRNVYSYFRNQLKIQDVRPTDLKSHFCSNPKFLQERSIDWLQKLYAFLNSVPSLFSEDSYGNILDAPIVRTASNRIVAPYRKTEAGHIENVFLPTKDGNIDNLPDIEFVDPKLYEKCRSFFEKSLRLKAPNEYEYFTKSLAKRYLTSSPCIKLEEHIQDVRKILSFMKRSDYSQDLRSVLQKSFFIKCRRGASQIWVRPFTQRILFPQSESGLLLEEYYQSIATETVFLDFDIYQQAGLSFFEMRQFDVTDSILIEGQTHGLYRTGSPGHPPSWSTRGDFRWELTIDRIEDALLFISQNPKSQNSMVKSQTILNVLQRNRTKLVGEVWISGYYHPIQDEPSYIIHLLRRDKCTEKLKQWNGKWLYSESMQLVSQKEISKHDLNISLYGKVSLDSNLYELLGFNKGKIDLVEAYVKDFDSLPEEKRQTFFAIELERRYGMTPEQLSLVCNAALSPEADHSVSEEDEFEFPSEPVKNWDSLKKYSAQILSYANPVKYERIVRSIRVSRPQDDFRAYVMERYRIPGSSRYACQLCHRPSPDIIAGQLEQHPDVELDPLNLCLCPNCAQRFRSFRNNSRQAEKLLSSLLNLTVGDITESDPISIRIDDFDFWFTQTHAAQIIELLRLKVEATEAKKNEPKFAPQNARRPDTTASNAATSSASMSHLGQIPDNADVNRQEEESYRRDSAAYQEFVGKRIFHRQKRAYARVIALEGDYIILNFESGAGAGKNVKYLFAQCLDDGLIEVVD